MFQLIRNHFPLWTDCIIKPNLDLAQRQEPRCINTPPINGPATDPIRAVESIAPMATIVMKS